MNINEIATEDMNTPIEIGVLFVTMENMGTSIRTTLVVVIVEDMGAPIGTTTSTTQNIDKAPIGGAAIIVDVDEAIVKVARVEDMG